MRVNGSVTKHLNLNLAEEIVTTYEKANDSHNPLIKAEEILSDPDREFLG